MHESYIFKYKSIWNTIAIWYMQSNTFVILQKDDAINKMTVNQCLIPPNPCCVAVVINVVMFILLSWQLHTIVTDETCVQVTEMYQQEQPNGATGGSSATQALRALTEAAYQKKTEALLTDENCYKIIIVSLK